MVQHLTQGLSPPLPLRALRCPCRSLAPLSSGFRQASRLMKGELVRCPVRSPSVPSDAPPAVLTVVANRYAANHHRQNRYSLRLQVLGV